MLPVAGVAYNVNAALGQDGIVGVKTGSSSQAGGCLSFAVLRKVAGRPVTIAGVVLGVRATRAQPSELGGVISAAKKLLGSVGGGLEHAPGRQASRRPGQRVQRVDRRACRGRGTGVSVTAWPGTPVTVTVTPRPLGHAIRQGQPVTQATVTIGGEVHHITLVASRAAAAPSIGWLLTRL
jgi:D-alanyl-D-alanine carboxypeptidase (penicillin-binding protein 5/6)